MPYAKKYPGKPVINKRMNNRRMHLIATYKKNRRVLGVYSDSFDIFVDELKKRTKRKQQNVVIIDGDTGAGKSTLAIKVCFELAKKMKVPFNLEQDYIYTLEDLWKKLQNPNASPINFIDEGALLLSSKKAMTKENQDVVNLFNTMRSLGWSTIVCTPSIFQIDKSVRTTHADYRVHCSSEDHSLIKGYGRGFFEVSKAKRNEYSKDAEPYWYLQHTGVFGPLPEKIDAVYQPIKLAAQMRLIENTIKKSRGEKEATA